VLVASLLGACAGDDPAPASAGPTRVHLVAAIQDDVDAVLAAYGALDDRPDLTASPRLVTAMARLDATVQQLALAAQDLRAGDLGIGRVAAPFQLSMRAGQLAPELRAIKRAIRASELAPAAQAELLTAVARVQVAARSLDLSTGTYHASVNRVANDDALGEASDRNGPLFPGSQFYVLDEGHIDAVDAAFEDDQLGITIHDESIDPDVERDPRYTIMVAKSAAKIEIPDARFAFIGPIGSTAWILPENQLDAEAAGILWPGFSTEEIEPGVFVSDQVQIRFKQVVGPNGFSVFESPQDEATPPVVLVDSENGLPDTVTLPPSTHKHSNWAFESAGIYLVRVDVRGQLNVPGQPWVTSSSATLKFVVLP